MINDAVERMLLASDSSIMIEASKVATVRPENTLLHTLMLLSTVRYTAIPVVDREQHLVGTVSMPQIVAGVMGGLEYNWDLLQEKKVAEVVDRAVGFVYEDDDLEDVLHLMVDHNFVCVISRSQVFKGIITRKEILKRVNFMAHELEHYYELEERSSEPDGRELHLRGARKV